MFLLAIFIIFIMYFFQRYNTPSYFFAHIVNSIIRSVTRVDTIFVTVLRIEDKQ
jgi:hypothetical protein